MKACKPKKCAECLEYFQPRNSLQKVCGYKCAVQRVQRTNDKKASASIKKEEKSRRQAVRKAKEALKSKSDYLRECQVVFNQFIRLRDEKYGCISCAENIVEQSRGGNYDAGHYRSRGAAPELRFCEDNCFKQCKKCNRQLSGNVVEMRKGILTRIGEERLAIVEGYREQNKYSIDDLKQLKTKYKAKIKQLQG